MTEYQMRRKVADWMVSYVGCKEGSEQHKAILKVFNDSGLCTRVKMATSYAWCAAATSAAFIANGYAGAPGSGSLYECVECYCDYLVSMAKKQGIWVENDAYKPSVGDVVLYAWDDSGSGDCTLSTDHVGIVYSVSGSTFRVIEGNISDTVGYRTLQVNNRYIRGFITPDYAKFAAGGTATADTVDYSPSVARGVQKFKNSTGADLPVYSGTRMDNKTGSLNPGESCYCFGKVWSKETNRWLWLVAYSLDDYPAEWKTGYVDDGGGTTF